MDSSSDMTLMQMGAAPPVLPQGCRQAAALREKLVTLFCTAGLISTRPTLPTAALPTAALTWQTLHGRRRLKV